MHVGPKRCGSFQCWMGLAGPKISAFWVKLGLSGLISSRALQNPIIKDSKNHGAFKRSDGQGPDTTLKTQEEYSNGLIFMWTPEILIFQRLDRLKGWIKFKRRKRYKLSKGFALLRSRHNYSDSSGVFHNCSGGFWFVGSYGALYHIGVLYYFFLLRYNLTLRKYKGVAHVR